MVQINIEGQPEQSFSEVLAERQADLKAQLSPRARQSFTHQQNQQEARAYRQYQRTLERQQRDQRRT